MKGFMPPEKVAALAQCWLSPWRAVAREPRVQSRTHVLAGTEIEVPFLVDHPMPTRMIRLRPNEMQMAAMTGRVRVQGS